MSEPEHSHPINPLPPVVVALFLLIAGIEMVFALGAQGILGGPEAIGWRIAAIQNTPLPTKSLVGCLPTISGPWSM